MIKGSHHSLATRKKLQQINLKNPTRYWVGKKRVDMISNQWNAGRPSWNKGKNWSAAFKTKVSKNIKKLWQDKAYRAKMLEAHQLRVKGKMELHYNWKGGKSFEPYPPTFNKYLKEKIKERDNYTCQGCGTRKMLAIHHIDYNKENCQPLNLITLCRSCNPKANYDRQKWKKFYQQLQSQRLNEMTP